ncbi:hypothetical protein [Brevundimonas bacteroides]|uniref:hypothetical protein n=1 Tax=Brevundimonas bacteroides TaxID=74311 RepID=UPI00049747E2|nr:hypothetical protein [Brevundimonas bacteroides]
MRRAAWLVLAALALVLAGCDLFEPPASERGETGERAEAPVADGAFRHSQSEDLSGFYTPVAETGEGEARLLLVFIGQPADFEAWEKGTRDGGFAPVMLEFAGGQRVLPERYEVSDSRVRFSGTSEALGRVTLDARLDGGALALARRNLGTDEDPAMEGTVTVDGRSFGGVKFAWSMGGG